MKIQPLSIPDVLLLTPRKFGDERGFFSETFSQQRFAEAGITGDFVQDNFSLSREINVVRGLHFQKPPHCQAKIVRCVRGRVLDVAVDIRVGSPWFGQWVAQELSWDNWNQMYVPEGFLHGFAVLEPDTEFLYKVSDYYAPECDAGVAWDDPDLGIDWHIDSKDAILSDKDKKLPRMADFESPFVYEG